VSGKVGRVLLSLGALLLGGCASHTLKVQEEALTTVVLQDRNGFSETVSQPDRLARLSGVDFTAPQSYEKVIRVFQRREDGAVPSVLTCYYPNGQLSDLLDVVSGRASGRYCHWHPNGQIHIYTVVMGGVGDVNERAKQTWLFDGESLVWDEEGHLTARIPYDRGALHGTEQRYYSSGALQESTHYQKGLPQGTHEAYSPEGLLLQRIEYEQGLLHGRCEQWWPGEQRPQSEEIWSMGRLLKATYYSSKGTVLGHVTDGNGERLVFEQGHLARKYQVQGGVIEGKVDEYTPAGMLSRTWHEVQGVKQGTEKVYDRATGRLKLELTWKEDQLQGPTRTYYADGKLESQKELSENQLHGRCMAWYPTGQVMLLEEYQHGVLERGEYYELGSLVPISQVVQGHGTATLYDAQGHKTKTILIVNGIPAP